MSDQENQASRFARDMAANAEKMFKATQLIANTRDEDVNIGTTPKHLVMRRDKVELFRYEPMAQATAKTPVLLAYGLIGRYTMADLQPDRSLVRSLLSKGLDLWLIDWGQPGRTERWLTIDDYVDDYIDAAVDRIAQETGQVVDLSDGVASIVGAVPCGYVYVDGSSVGETTEALLKDRRILRDEGFVTIIVVRDSTTGKVAAGPEIQARGFAEDQDVFDEVLPKLEQALADAAGNGVTDSFQLQQIIRRTVGSWVGGRLRRRPMIIPIVIDA
jgi:hypothetical protein